MKVGDYVITKDRLHIGKIYNINECREPSMIYAIDFPNADDFIFMGESDFKSSPDIIDLIEVGDIVKIEYQGWHQVSTKFETLKFFDDEGTEYLYDEIKAIITREQLEAIKYEIK